MERDDIMIRNAVLQPSSFYKEANMNTETVTDIAMNFNDPKWILEHLIIALQRSSDESLVKRSCDLDGIEQYLILQGEKDGSCYTVKVVPIILANVGIDEDQAWKRHWKTLVWIPR